MREKLNHPSGIHAQNLVLNPADILGSFGDELRLKAAVPIPRNYPSLPSTIQS